MLSSLHIENYILIDSLDVSFPEGLIIITGQTGAGKSILLGALSLLSGSKADASSISAGADSCVVEAEFDVPEDDFLRETVDESGCEWDGGHLIVRRVIYSSGRTRAFINDSPVPLSVLQTVSSRLFDIHSQHQSLLLTDRRFQLSLLDHFAGNSDVLDSCRSVWSRLQGAKRSLSVEEERHRRIEEERDYIEAQYRKLEAAALKDENELESLEAELKTLSNAEDIKSMFNRVLGDLNPDDAPGMDASLKDVSRQLDRLSSFLPGMSALSERIESVRIELGDIVSEIESADASVSCSPERLEAVSDRLSLLYSLLKKHGASSVSELMSIRDGLAGELDGAADSEDRILALRRQVSELESRHAEICAELSTRRKEACRPFAADISSSLAALELDRAVFIVDVREVEAGEYGCDSVVFEFSSTGKDPVDVAKCASGGEISRIMLCLKSMMSGYAGMPTLIFDEIDTGVSGSVADKMGAMICEMGRKMQVLAITHLPQVAAKGNAHYVVTKTFKNDGNAVSSLSRLEGESRINEIARLLSGSELTAEAVANAKALLGQADREIRIVD